MSKGSSDSTFHIPYSDVTQVRIIKIRKISYKIRQLWESLNSIISWYSFHSTYSYRNIVSILLSFIFSRYILLSYILDVTSNFRICLFLLMKSFVRVIIFIGFIKWSFKTSLLTYVSCSITSSLESLLSSTSATRSSTRDASSMLVIIYTPKSSSIPSE